MPGASTCVAKGPRAARSEAGGRQVRARALQSCLWVSRWPQDSGAVPTHHGICEGQGVRSVQGQCEQVSGCSREARGQTRGGIHILGHRPDLGKGLSGHMAREALKDVPDHVWLTQREAAASAGPSTALPSASELARCTCRVCRAPGDHQRSPQETP